MLHLAKLSLQMSWRPMPLQDPKLIATILVPGWAHVKLIAKNLTRQRVGPVPPAATRLLHAHDLCVALHESWQIPAQSVELSEEPEEDHTRARPSAKTVVQVEPRSLQALQDHLAVLSFCNADVEALRSGMIAWSARAQLHYRLMGLPPDVCSDCHNGIRMLVLNGAFPSSDTGLSLSDSQLHGMQLLQRWGYVSATQSQGSVVWRFTDGKYLYCVWVMSCADRLQSLSHWPRETSQMRYWKPPPGSCSTYCAAKAGCCGEPRKRDCHASPHGCLSSHGLVCVLNLPWSVASGI